MKRTASRNARMLASGLAPPCGGFTLVELLAVTFIMGAVLATATRIMMASTRNYARESTTVQVEQDLAAARNVFDDDMSIAGYAATPSTTFESVTTQTSADSVTFRGDIDSSGGSFADRICYQLSGGSLQRKVVLGGASAPAACGTTGFETLVDDVSLFTLRFLDASRTVIPAGNVAGILDGTANPRYVALQLTINRSVGSGAIAKTVAGEVALRNY
jgi:prepilin-type N-terminal cleavage/methylation domain-containing protein